MLGLLSVNGLGERTTSCLREEEKEEDGLGAGDEEESQLREGETGS